MLTDSSGWIHTKHKCFSKLLLPPLGINKIKCRYEYRNDGGNMIYLCNIEEIAQATRKKRAISFTVKSKS